MIQVLETRAASGHGFLRMQNTKPVFREEKDARHWFPQGWEVVADESGPRDLQ